MASISIHPPGGGVLWFRAEDVQSGRLAKYIRENISADVEVIVEDGGGAYPHGVADRKHERVNDRDEYVRLPSDSHQRNTAEGAVSPLKLDSVGNSHKRIRAKHVPAYLAQTIFGFNRRNLQTRFLDTLRHHHAQLAELGHVSRVRVCQILMLNNLAPAIQQSLLFLPKTARGRDRITERSLRGMAKLVDWDAQIQLFRSRFVG